MDSAGRGTGMVGMLKAITGQIDLEAQLSHFQEMEAVGTLASGVAQEFTLSWGHTRLRSVPGA